MSLRFFNPFLVLALLALPVSAQEKSKVAVVDMGRLLNQHPQTLALKAESEAEKKKLEEKNAERLEPITKINAELEQLAKLVTGETLSAEQKVAKRAEGAQKQQILMSLDRERQETVERGMKAIRENLVTKMAEIRTAVSEAVDAHAKAENYDYVFDITGQSTNLVPFILYIREKTDITPVVLGKMGGSEIPPAAPETPVAPAAPETPATPGSN